MKTKATAAQAAKAISQFYFSWCPPGQSERFAADLGQLMATLTAHSATLAVTTIESFIGGLSEDGGEVRRDVDLELVKGGDDVG
jgi:hypothetical protein